MDIVKLICLLHATVLMVDSQPYEDLGSISCNPAREGTVTTLNINLYERYATRLGIRINNQRLQFHCFGYRLECVKVTDNYDSQFTWNYTVHPESRNHWSMSLFIFNTSRETVHGIWSIFLYGMLIQTSCAVYENIENMICSKNGSADTLEIDCMASNIHHASKCIFHVNYTAPLNSNTIKLNESEIRKGKEENVLLESNDTYTTRCRLKLRQPKVQGVKYDIAVTMYPVGNATEDSIQFGTTKMFSFEADFVQNDTATEIMRLSLTTEGSVNVSVVVGVTFGVISLVLFIVASAIIARKYRVGKKIDKKSCKNSLELQQNKDHFYDKTIFEDESFYQNMKDANESTYVNKVGGKLIGSSNEKQELALERTVENGDSFYEEMQMNV